MAAKLHLIPYMVVFVEFERFVRAFKKLQLRKYYLNYSLEIILQVITSFIKHEGL